MILGLIEIFQIVVVAFKHATPSALLFSVPLPHIHKTYIHTITKHVCNFLFIVTLSASCERGHCI